MDTLKAQKARGVSVMIVAHRTSVLAVADRLMVMRDGRIDLYGPRDAVLAQLSGSHIALHPNLANRIDVR